MSTPTDVIVIGCGAMGSAACNHLARRGLRVLGLDRFDIPNEMGSSHGGSRMIRGAYFEDPRYVPLTRAAFTLWREVERESGTTLLHPAGCLNMGPPDDQGIRGVRRSVREHHLPHEILDAVEIRRRWPIFRPNEADMGVYESDAGILIPERCVLAQVDTARRCGAVIQGREPVERWRADGNRMTVRTPGTEYTCRHLVITAGPWLGELVTGLKPVLSVERQVQAWFRPVDGGAFGPARMPAFIHFVADGAFYGIPAIDGRGVKFCRHHGGETTTADAVRRDPAPIDASLIRSYLARHVPTADGEPVEMKVCLYTNTPDGHFVVGPHRELRNVYLAGGFSGHGFKFAPVIGAALADLITSGRTQYPIGLFEPARLAFRP